MATLPRINFTHTGTFCEDLDMMVDFYCQKLGFIVSDKGVASTGHRLFFLTQNPEVHHQVVLFDGKPHDLPFNPINQLSFLLDSIDDLKSYYRFARENGIEGIEQVDHGNAWSMYFKDPEGNPIEMYVDSPFYTNQPCREPGWRSLPTRRPRPSWPRPKPCAAAVRASRPAPSGCNR